MAETTALKGVTLTRSNLGGFVVMWKDQAIGWINKNGDCWNAYQSAVPPRQGVKLGRYPKEDAVRQIAIAAGWPRSKP